MSVLDKRNSDQKEAIHRSIKKIKGMVDQEGNYRKVSDYYAENVFDFRTAEGIPEGVRSEMIETARKRELLKKEHVELVANLVLEWATAKGATHFCHWFHPLTGNSAEKHDAFLNFSNEKTPIEKLGVNQLTQGEPDASSFPHGGARSTFEARGYTIWDMSSPMFIREGTNGKILCIPTAFVSYRGDALDIKTPLLRSIKSISEATTKFLQLVGRKNVSRVKVTCGAEQEYFLIDKSFYYSRPDLVMAGRTLFGSLTAKNQQLSDHYFGTVPERVLSFMQELDQELYRLGVPSKTRHNEVAPGQFEVAPIHKDANLSSDQNQLTMALIKKIALQHDFVALLHEKPFSKMNGSGKHLNWSLSDDKGSNLLEPGTDPHQNNMFLALVSIIVEAIHRHANVLRMSIAGHGNDHRLGGHEAPPSIISVFLGKTLMDIYGSLVNGGKFTPTDSKALDLGAEDLAQLLVDNTDRNRTSPFAFTGNRFEFRAVGSSQPIGFPLTVLNAAVAEVMEESNEILKNEIDGGADVDSALLNLTRKWMQNSMKVVFNGDGYSNDWIKEATERGLPNLKTTVDALEVLKDQNATKFLSSQDVIREGELKMRYNVLLERYNQHREIEFSTLTTMIQQFVLPAGIKYRKELLDIMKTAKELKSSTVTESETNFRLTSILDSLHKKTDELSKSLAELSEDPRERALKLANELLPLSEEIATDCNNLESLIPDQLWNLPKYYDMLFLH